MHNALMLAFPPLLSVLLPVLGHRSEEAIPALNHLSGELSSVAADPLCECKWYYTVIVVTAAPAGQAPTFAPAGGAAGRCTYHHGGGGWEDYCDQYSACSGPFTVTVTTNGGTLVWDPNPPPLGTFANVSTLTWDGARAGVGCGAPARTQNVRIYVQIPPAQVGEYDIQAGCSNCNDK